MYRLQFDDQKCEHTRKGCKCGLTLHWPSRPELGSIRIEPQKHGRYMEYGEKLFECIREIMNRYVIENGKVVKREVKVPNDTRVLEAAFDFFSTPSNRRVAPPFERMNLPPTLEKVTNENLRPIVQKIDRMYFLSMGVDITTVRKEKVMTLKERCLLMLTFEQVVFGTFGGYKAMVNTADNMSVEKILHLFAEFSGPGTSRQKQKDLEWLLPQALTYLEQALKVADHKGIVNFRYSKDMLPKFVSSSLSASGVRAGVPKSEVIGEMRFVQTPVAKKLEQYAYYAERFHRAMQLLYKKGLEDEEVQELLEIYCHIGLKQEVKFVWPITEEKCAKLLMKCREFFIPNMTQQFLSKLLMTPRQKLERGDYIRIGQKWNYGGAQEFARFMNAGHPDMVWHYGDVNKLDKSIKDWLLGMYVSSGQAYFRVGPGSKKFVEDLFVLLCEKICVKLVNHVHGAWTVMLSFMYSGGFETSHGDSWCMLLVWFLYICWTIEKKPKYAQAILQGLFSLIVIAVYGDDHVWSTPRQLSHVLNEHLFGKFTEEYLDMTIRDPEMTSNFFSKVNSAGEVVRPGVVFLKRYFVLDTSMGPGYPFIYPFKPTHETMLKLFAAKDGLDITFIMQSIGQAYDTLGTNKVAYDLCYEFYEYYMSKVPYDLSTVVSKFFESGDVAMARRMLKKAGVTRAELELGFPSRKILMELHKIDEEKRSHKIAFRSSEQLYGLDEDDSFDLNAYIL